MGLASPRPSRAPNEFSEAAADPPPQTPSEHHPLAQAPRHAIAATRPPLLLGGEIDEPLGTHEHLVNFICAWAPRLGRPPAGDGRAGARPGATLGGAPDENAVGRVSRRMTSVEPPVAPLIKLMPRAMPSARAPHRACRTALSMGARNKVVLACSGPRTSRKPARPAGRRGPQPRAPTKVGGANSSAPCHSRNEQRPARRNNAYRPGRSGRAAPSAAGRANSYGGVASGHCRNWKSMHRSWQHAQGTELSPAYPLRYTPGRSRLLLARQPMSSPPNICGPKSPGHPVRQRRTMS